MKGSSRAASVGLIALSALLGGTALSSAQPLYIGYSIDGGETIIDVTSNNNTLPNTLVSTPTGGVGIFNAVTTTATSSAPQATLFSDSIDLSTTGGTGSLWVYITSANNNVGGVNSNPNTNGFESGFTSNITGSGLSVTEATYVNNCKTSPGCNSTVGSDVFNLANQIASATFLANGSTVDVTGSPITVISPYAVTELYKISCVSCGANASANLSIDLFTPTPLPGALPLFAGGLGVLGLLARRRKKSVAAV